MLWYLLQVPSNKHILAFNAIAASFETRLTPTLDLGESRLIAFSIFKSKLSATSVLESRPLYISSSPGFKTVVYQGTSPYTLNLLK